MAGQTGFTVTRLILRATYVQQSDPLPRRLRPQGLRRSSGPRAVFDQRRPAFASSLTSAGVAAARVVGPCHLLDRRRHVDQLLRRQPRAVLLVASAQVSLLWVSTSSFSVFGYTLGRRAAQDLILLLRPLSTLAQLTVLNLQITATAAVGDGRRTAGSRPPRFSLSRRHFYRSARRTPGHRPRIEVKPGSVDRAPASRPGHSER